MLLEAWRDFEAQCSDFRWALCCCLLFCFLSGTLIAGVQLPQHVLHHCCCHQTLRRSAATSGGQGLDSTVDIVFAVMQFQA
jgi:hypothetical protein